MIDGRQDPIPPVWEHRTDTPVSNSTRTIAPGLEPYRLPPARITAFSPATAHRSMTISISLRKRQKAGFVRASLATIRERLGDAQARVVLCGHSHQQHFIQLPDGPTILNPGSVGCPSYDDPGNEPHLSESGSPHARYAILDINEDQMSADMIAITYDWKSAVARAESNGRHDWANGLRTGWFMAKPGRRHFTSTVGTEGHC